MSQYRHDCAWCRFLGRYDDGGVPVDLYHCVAVESRQAATEGKVVVRRGDGPEAMEALPIETLRRHEAALSGDPTKRAFIAGFGLYLSTHHEIDDVVVRGWRCRMFRSPLGFVTLSAVDDELDVFADCHDYGDDVNARTMQAATAMAKQLMHDKIEDEMLRRRRRWKKR